MLRLTRKKRFSKDYQKIAQTGRNLDRFAEAIVCLQNQEPLPPHFRDHALTGNWKGYRECHLGGDLLLIYDVIGEELVLVRLGSHSELFS